MNINDFKKRYIKEGYKLFLKRKSIVKEGLENISVKSQKELIRKELRHAMSKVGKDALAISSFLAGTFWSNDDPQSPIVRYLKTGRDITLSEQEINNQAITVFKNEKEKDFVDTKYFKYGAKLDNVPLMVACAMHYGYMIYNGIEYYKEEYLKKKD